jgi:peptidoglycan/xylan/chitin deacetylase (PgdA/CDA1 family)
MITVRDDDVLLPSSSHKDPFARFKLVHELIVEHGAHHIPTILCGEIQAFPEAVEYIKIETAAGNMTPELHGWLHSPYHQWSGEEVEADLKRCVEWFTPTFGHPPTRFYTPWGSNTPIIAEAAKKHGMILVDCTEVLPPTHVRRHPEKYRGHQDAELFIHWWEGINRLNTALGVLNDVR